MTATLVTLGWATVLSSHKLQWSGNYTRCWDQQIYLFYGKMCTQFCEAERGNLDKQHPGYTWIFLGNILLILSFVHLFSARAFYLSVLWKMRTWNYTCENRIVSCLSELSSFGMLASTETQCIFFKSCRINLGSSSCKQFDLIDLISQIRLQHPRSFWKSGTSHANLWEQTGNL